MGPSHTIWRKKSTDLLFLDFVEVEPIRIEGLGETAHIVGLSAVAEPLGVPL